MNKTLQSRPHDLLKRHSGSRKSEHGQSFIEFTLIVPMLFIMLIGVAFIAQGFNLQMVLYGAAYEGARIWAKNPAGGDNIHCTPPACDPDAGSARNFEKYVMPSVRQYVTNNGFDGNKLFFYSEDERSYARFLEILGNNSQLVKIIVLYPIELPVGNFAGGYQRILIGASCTLKRGA